MLNLGSRSLQAQQQGVAVAGQNLANVNNPAYARQRLNLQTSTPTMGGMGPEGSGVDAVGITQLRNAFLDVQVRSETSVRISSIPADRAAIRHGGPRRATRQQRLHGWRHQRRFEWRIGG